MSGETAARGWVLKISDMATSPTYTAIKNVSNPQGPNRSRNIIETDHHSATATVILLGLKNNGQITFDIDYDDTDTQHALLRDAVDDAVDYDWQIIKTTSGAEQAAFSGYVTEWSEEAPVGGVNKASVTIRLTSDPTFS